MYYVEPIYRPPSEYNSLLIQATVGCSAAAAGRCHFCNSNIFNKNIPQKSFRIRPVDDILVDLTKGQQIYGENVEKIFLLDSNAMVMKSADLLKIVERSYALFPRLKQVSCYACSGDILRKEKVELMELRQAGLNMVFVGLESGDEQVLKFINKGTSVDKQIRAVVKANEAGIRTSVSVILGIGGRQYTKQHAMNTGRAVSAMSPTYLAALSLMVVPGTVLDAMVQDGRFELLDDPLELLNELQILIENIDALHPIIFRSNHASNYLSLRGTFPGDKEKMLNLISDTMNHPERLKGEHLRGL